MIARFKITNEDLIAQQEDAVDSTKIHRKNKFMQSILGLLLILFVFYIADFTGEQLIIGLITYVIVIPFMNRIVYKKLYISNYKRMYLKEQKNRIGDVTLTLSEDKLIRESERTTERVMWTDINKVTEDQERYFLYLTGLNAIIIRKRPDNMDDQELVKYQEFLRRKLFN